MKVPSPNQETSDKCTRSKAATKKPLEYAKECHNTSLDIKFESMTGRGWFNLHDRPHLQEQLGGIIQLTLRWKAMKVLVLATVVSVGIWHFVMPVRGPHKALSTSISFEAWDIDSTGSTLGYGIPKHLADAIGSSIAEPVQDADVLDLSSVIGTEAHQGKITFPTPPKDPSVSQYVHAILNAEDINFPKLSCPTTIGHRYASLQSNLGESHIKYFIALNLYKVAPLLPRLMGTIIETIKYLGPAQCALSIIGRSNDNTYRILEALRPPLEALGTHYYLDSSPIDPQGEGTERISALSTLRNMALAPLLTSNLYGPDTIITFINDIAPCPSDILELLYQHKYQNATQTCAFDWIHDGACFYDVWVSRSMTGDTFFEIPQDGSWAYLDNLFWDSPESKDKFNRVQPLQVYACWGGMVTLSSQPFLERKIAFRASREGECYMGEPTTLAKDLWGQGIARIAAIPSVNVGYSNEEGAKIKLRRGKVEDHVDTSRPPSEPQTELLEWQVEPPGHLKCVGMLWNDAHWVDAV